MNEVFVMNFNKYTASIFNTLGIRMKSSKFLTPLIMAIIFGIENAHCRDCPQRYARFSANHSFCLDPNPTCSIVKSGVSSNDKKIILDVHNDFRSKVANGKESRAGGLPPAADMLKMEWDPELAAIAQRWATQCKFNHDCNDCRRVESFYVGQNMAQSDTSTCTSDDCINSVKPDWKGMITMFYEEVSVFDKAYINPFQMGNDYGHFSQVVWAETWRVGCGYVAFKNEDTVRSLYVCNYGPGGNFGEGPMYKEGKVCSACPSNTKCDNNGLCKVENQSVGPVYKTNKDSLMDCNWKAGNSTCNVKVEGKNDWKMKRSLSGNYMTTFMKAGEKSIMKMTTFIEPKGDSFCVEVHSRKGPANAAEQDSSNMVLLLNIPEWNYSTLIKMNYQSKAFTPFSMDIGWNKKTNISLEFSVPEGTIDHIIDVKDIVVFDGKCSSRK